MSNSLTISELMTILEAVLEEEGDLPVVLEETTGALRFKMAVLTDDVTLPYVESNGEHRVIILRPLNDAN